LVGDSAAMTLLGHPNTLPATMDMMCLFSNAVSRACERAHVIGDMPYMSYQVSPTEAIRNAGRLMTEGLVDSVKLEGGRSMVPAVRGIVDAGIPVMGHLGLTPQSVSAIGGYRVQGRSVDAAINLLEDALALQEAGAYTVLLELVPAKIAGVITDKLDVPTISTGSGPEASGHCQILHDVIGMFEQFTPRHARQYAQVGQALREGFAKFNQDIKERSYPGPENSFKVKREELDAFREYASKR